MKTKPTAQRQALDCLKQATRSVDRLGQVRAVLASEFAVLESLGIPADAMRAASERIFATEALCNAIAHECEATLLNGSKRGRS